MTHELKSWPEQFDAVWVGFKTDEIRFDDRGYDIGDLLVLRKWCPALKAFVGEPCGVQRRIEARVMHVTRSFGLKDGHVALSLHVLRRIEVKI